MKKIPFKILLSLLLLSLSLSVFSVSSHFADAKKEYDKNIENLNSFNQLPERTEEEPVTVEIYNFNKENLFQDLANTQNQMNQDMISDLNKESKERLKDRVKSEAKRLKASFQSFNKKFNNPCDDTPEPVFDHTKATQFELKYSEKNWNEPYIKDIPLLDKIAKINKSWQMKSPECLDLVDYCLSSENTDYICLSESVQDIIAAKNNEETKKLTDSEKSGMCCTNGLCDLGKDATSCNMIKGTLLAGRAGSKNDGLFGLLSNIARVGASQGKTTTIHDDNMSDELCKKCWGQAYRANPNESNEKRDREEVGQYLLKTTSKTKESIKDSLNGRFKHYLNRLDLRSIDLKKKLSCFSEKDIHKIAEEHGCKISNVTDVFKAVNIDANEVNIISDLTPRSTDSSKEKVELYKKNIISLIEINQDENPELLINKCKAFKENEKISSTGFMESLMYNVEDVNKNELAIFLLSIDSKILRSIKRSPSQFCDKYSESKLKFSQIIAQEDIPKKTDLNLCPSQRDLVEVICKKDVDDESFHQTFPREKLESLNSAQHIVLNEWICRGKVSISKDETGDSEKNNKEKTKLSNVYELLEKVSDSNKILSNNPRIISKRNNFAVSGKTIMDNIKNKDQGITDSDLDPTSTSAFSANPDFADQFKNLTGSNSQLSNNQASMMDDLQERVDKIGMDDIAKAVTSNPGIGNDIDRVADLIGQSKDNKLKESVDNPNQAVMDYLAGKDDKESVKALKSSENDDLRRELDELKKKINDEKISTMASQKDAASKELDAARVRIKKLENMVARIQSKTPSNSQGQLQPQIGGQDIARGESSIRFSSQGGQARGAEQSRGPASAQMPILTKIPVSVQADLKSYAKSGIEFKNNKLVLVVDETDYPLEIEQVVMKDGVVSGIRVQKSNSEIVTITLSEMQVSSQEAVRDYIKKEGSNIIESEKKNEKSVEEKLAKASESYIQFLCSIHPEDSQCTSK
jgi:hypothetical protein